MLKFLSTCIKCNSDFSLEQLNILSEFDIGSGTVDDNICPQCLMLAQKATELDSLKQIRSDLIGGRNFVLIGPGGSGKTIILRKIITQLRLASPPVIFDILCPTGSSAIQIGGITLHSLFGWSKAQGAHGAFLGLSCSKLVDGSISNGKIIKHIVGPKSRRYKKNIKRLVEIGTLLFDEFSMISYEQFRAMDRICRVLKNRLDIPFGGIQIILSGDAFQLPPIHGTCSFLGPSWDELNFVIHEISPAHLHRFTTSEFSDMTRMIRLGILSDIVKEKFASRHQSPPNQIMELYFTNADVAKYNNLRYSELTEPEHIYQSILSLRLSVVSSEDETIGELRPLSVQLSESKFAKSQLDVWPSTIPHDKLHRYANDELKQFTKNLKQIYGEEYMSLRFKPGTRIICTVNHKENERLLYANGTTGQIIECRDGAVKITVDNGSTILVQPKQIDTVRRIRLEEGHVVDIKVAFLHIPFRLGYAITFNRSQGMTMDTINVNGKGLSKKTGLLYVGLSRCRSLETLYLNDIDLYKLKANSGAIMKFQNHVINEIRHLYNAHPEWFNNIELCIDRANLSQKIFEIICYIKIEKQRPRLDSSPSLNMPEELENKQEEQKILPNNSDDTYITIMPLFEAETKLTMTASRGSSQKQLREWLLKECGKCVITGETLPIVLDVAHIKPYSQFKDDIKVAHQDNGMLLRKDLHILYDEGHIGFESDGTILKSRTLMVVLNYAQYTKVELPSFVSREHLEWHRKNIYKADL